MDRSCVFLLGLIAGVLIAGFAFAVAPIVPRGINADRQRGCQLAGHRGIVIDSFSVIYCTNYTDLVPWEE